MTETMIFAASNSSGTLNKGKYIPRLLYYGEGKLASASWQLSTYRNEDMAVEVA